MLRIPTKSLVCGLALTLLGMVPGRDGCMHGEERGLPFVMLTNRCTVGGEGVVGWAVPLAADPGTNPPSTPMLRVDSVAFNLIAWSALAALALRPVLQRSASHPATSRPVGPSSVSP